MKALIHLLFGRCETIVTRRVTDEEMVSMTFYSRRPDEAFREVDHALHNLRDHMVAYNQSVVLAHRNEIRTLAEQVAQKQAELSDITAQLQQAQSAKVQRVK